MNHSRLNGTDKKSITLSSQQKSHTLPLLVFDFDGVISNSIHDSFRTALNTFISIFPENRLPLIRPIHPAGQIFDFENEHPSLFNDFNHLIPFGNRAEDYYVILKIMEQNKSSDVIDQKSYDTFKASLAHDHLESYHRAFYDIRQSYQNEDKKKWSELLPAFPGVIEAIKLLSKRFILAIATSKDQASIHIQLESYGLRPYFSPQNILDKELSNSKKHHLKQLHQMHNIPYNQIHFIDDKVLHLISVAELGVQCYLPTWGFNTAREQTIARERGFHLIQIKDLPNIGLHPL